MQNRILKSIMILSLCLSYSQAEEETGFMAKIKLFFGAIPPQDVDRGEGISRTFTPSPKKVSIDSQHNAASELFSDSATLDGYWKENTMGEPSDHALTMEEPGRLMPAERGLDQPIAPTIPVDQTPPSDPVHDLTPAIEMPLEPGILERPLTQTQQPSAAEDALLPSPSPQSAIDNTTQFPTFSPTLHPDQLEPMMPDSMVDEMPGTMEHENPEPQPQLFTQHSPQHFENIDESR
ncbi:hypothetical protein [Candidatus Odyssella acanthamoebae]|uniref:Uncharacterized protein n=1 Tax=Candidatus Odyssella acanthamoebae TaxID=91604 RepID=A0A077AVT6_9PROT|nr:hypothetical protein [Candidatus Paracaedibacter acanthamoebae]AIK96159.1 hypothetical protein ID47_04490 [Candidatus Paracaedibacter acanthamoebae]